MSARTRPRVVGRCGGEADRLVPHPAAAGSSLARPGCHEPRCLLLRTRRATRRRRAGGPRAADDDLSPQASGQSVDLAPRQAQEHATRAGPHGPRPHGSSAPTIPAYIGKMLSNISTTSSLLQSAIPTRPKTNCPPPFRS